MARIAEPYEVIPNGAKASDRSSAEGDTHVPSACFQFELTSGANAGWNFTIDEARPPMFVGRSAVCELRLMDPAVARRHLRFEVAASRLVVRDAPSSKGTFINGVRASVAHLEGGETIRIGETSIAVKRSVCQLERRAPVKSFGTFVGASLAVRRLYASCAEFAASTAPLMIEGEPGAGKEALARAIHDASERASGPFVALDCTAMPPAQLAVALFGREARPSFAGEDVPSVVAGAFEQARGGTLFIEEVGELDLGLQARLLEALEGLEVRRIGSHVSRPIDVRVIVATRRDLDVDVEQGRFLDALFARLASGYLALPPLRERTGDVELLASHFWAIHTRWRAQPFPASSLARWKAYAWPGNVHELSSTLARLAAFGEIRPKEARELFVRRSTPPDAHDTLDELIAASDSFADARARIIAEFERRYIGFLDAHHVGERARVSASGLSDRYLRVLRGRARGAVRRSNVC